MGFRSANHMNQLGFSPITLSFIGEGEEMKYRNRQFDNDLSLLRYISLLAFLIELLYSFKDYNWSPHLPQEVVAFRFFYLASIMLITFILTYSKWIKKHTSNLYALSILIMLSLVFGQYYMTAMNDTPGSSFAKTLPLIFFATYLFAGIKFKHILYITPMLILAYIIVIVYYEKIPNDVKINDSVLVAMNLILAVFFKYILEMNIRKSYITQLRVEESELVLEENLHNEKVLSSMRKDLIGILAHDIRAPLGNLQGIISLLNAKTLSSEKGEELLIKVNKRIKIITNGVNDLLEWVKSKDEGLELNVTEFDINDLVDEVLNILLEQIETKQITVAVDIQAKLLISTDKGALQSILRNLISNAIKFSNEGGKLQINAHDNSDKVIFEIIDSGIGMDEVTIQKILNGFHSTSGTNNETGVGLGLQICFTLLGKLSSELKIDSKVGEGTKMSFELV